MTQDQQFLKALHICPDDIPAPCERCAGKDAQINCAEESLKYTLTQRDNARDLLFLACLAIGVLSCTLLYEVCARA